jgi:HAMP domain-containing protein
MATERVTETSDAPVHERTTYVDRGGGGIGGVVIGIALLALVAIIAFFLLSANRQDTLRTSAVSDAASSVANSAATASRNVSGAAQQTADSVAPAQP